MTNDPVKEELPTEVDQILTLLLHHTNAYFKFVESRWKLLRISLKELVTQSDYWHDRTLLLMQDLLNFLKDMLKGEAHEPVLPVKDKGDPSSFV